MSLDAIRTKDLMPDIGNARNDQQKIDMLLDYIVQLKEQMGWELDTLKKKIQILEAAAKSAKNTPTPDVTISSQEAAEPMMLSAEPAEQEESNDV